MIQGLEVSTFSRLIPDVGANFTSSSPISVTETLVALIEAVTHLKNDLNDISSVLFKRSTLSEICPSNCVFALSPMDIATILAE